MPPHADSTRLSFGELSRRGRQVQYVYHEFQPSAQVELRVVLRTAEPAIVRCERHNAAPGQGVGHDARAHAGRVLTWQHVAVIQQHDRKGSLAGWDGGHARDMQIVGGVAHLVRRVVVAARRHLMQANLGWRKTPRSQRGNRERRPAGTAGVWSSHQVPDVTGAEGQRGGASCE